MCMSIQSRYKVAQDKSMEYYGMHTDGLGENLSLLLNHEDNMQVHGTQLGNIWVDIWGFEDRHKF